MEIKDILTELDERAGYMAPGHLRRWLLGQIDEYSAAKPDDVEGLCALYNEVGGIYRRSGDDAKAEEAFMQAKSVLEAQHEAEMKVEGSFSDNGSDDRLKQNISVSASESPEMAATLMNLAELYISQGKTEEALEALTTAENIYDNSDAVPGNLYAGCLNDKGRLLMEKGDYESAFDTLSKALEYLCEKARSPRFIGTTMYNLGMCMIGLGGREQAIECFTKAGEWFQAGGAEDGKARCDEMLERLGA